MSIPFTCECGKKMFAKEEFAGRRLRCPECHRVVAIPGMGTGTKILPKAGPKAAAKAAPPVQTQPKRKPARPAALHDTPTLSKTIPASASPAAPQIRKPPPATAAAKPAPVARALAPPVVQPVAAPVKPHPWCDTSLIQNATRWRAGDERVYQANVSPAREREFPLATAVSIAALLGFLVMAIAAA